MDKIQQYKIEKKLNLHLKFKEIKKILETKYRISIDFMMEYDILMVGGLNKDIKVISGDSINHVGEKSNLQIRVRLNRIKSVPPWRSVPPS